MKGGRHGTLDAVSGRATESRRPLLQAAGGAVFFAALLRGARLAALGEMDIPLARELRPALGEIQQLTATIDALYVPNIDESLDEQDAKRAFWAAFRTLGDWYAAQPPY